MISRLRIENYKCFSKFECQFGAFQLLVGDNGSGKTSVFDVVESLRDIVTRGQSITDAFPTHTLTAWSTLDVQTFEMEVEGNGGRYQYHLCVDQDRLKSKSWINNEHLYFYEPNCEEETPLFVFNGVDAMLYKDDGSDGPSFPFDSARSPLSTIPERPDNKRLTWFRRRMERVFVFSPDSPRMTANCDSEIATPDRQLHQFASWLRHLNQERGNFLSLLSKRLADGVLEGLENLRLERVSEAVRELKLDFDYSGSKPFALSFNSLSDGQRHLVALYTILAAAIEPDSTVCLDEPDNFVALREIQPWLSQLSDAVEDRKSQCLLVSHQSESLNYLAAQHGLIFERTESGSVGVRPFEWEGQEMLTPAEVVARGWE